MPIPRKNFLYFLLDTPTGKAYYRDNAGTLLTLPITAGTTMDISLQHSPGNWMDTLLSFVRNSTYHGINRSFSTPQDFVFEVADMIRDLFLNGVGTETPLTLAVFKYNSQPIAGSPTYELYYKGDLDSQNIDDTVLEKLTVNLMEGGVGKLLKSYENTVLQIPCDGSIPENIKVNLDGLRVQDTFFYQVTNIKGFTGVAYFLPANFISNEGDNYGIVRGTPSYQEIPAQLDDSGSYLLYSTQPITLKLKGSITVTNNNHGIDNIFRLYWTTQALPIVVNTLVPFTHITTPRVFYYEATITLQPYEKLFLIFQMTRVDATTQNEILSGDVSIEFASQYKSTRTWAVTGINLFKLMWKEICRLASTDTQTYSYEAVSALLEQYQNFAFASGDALRASGDPNYQRYFAVTEDGQTSFGPVIKKAMKEFYMDLSVPLCAALGIDHVNGEQLFLERMQDVYNSDTVTFDLGEVSGLKWRPAKDVMFSDLSIGYTPQTYDQKAGKFEYNTTLQMKAPINSFEKKLELISKTRWDSYGIEKLRSNIGEATSTTRNDSDNSLFGLNIDPDKWIFDYFAAHFSSLISDPANDSNTNIHFDTGIENQKLPLPVTDGEYFQPNTDQGIFVFSAVGYSHTEACNLSIDGIVNSVNKPAGTPPDTIAIKLWRNGAVIFTDIITVTGVNTPISINYDFTQLFQYRDCVYITVGTTATAEANINTTALTIGGYVSMSGNNIPVLGGTFQKLLSMPTVIPSGDPYIGGTSHVQYNYQYFLFNSIVPNTGFNTNLFVAGYTEAQNANFIVEIWINGVPQTDKITINGTVSRVAFNEFLNLPLRNFALGDIVFLTASVESTPLAVQITKADLTFTSNYIKAYSLKRVQYDSLLGIPNIATDADGNIRSDIAGAPYNIEDVTPKRCYNTWRNYLKSCFVDQVTGQMVFQTLSKNPYLSTSIGAVTITENSNEDVLTGERLFYPIEVEFTTQVQQTFANIMSATINAHVGFTFMGKQFYFFPNEMSQKPALNEAQTWKGFLSPKTNLNIFANIKAFKIPDMSPNSISCAKGSPVQFVPYTRVLPAKYHTYNRNEFLFEEQIQRWFEKGGYHQPVQKGDFITLQFITREIDPIFYSVFTSEGVLYRGPQDLNTIASPAITDPYVLWQYNILTSDWDEGCYYIIIESNTAGKLLISECMHVQTDWDDTVLIEYSNGFNAYGMVFDGSRPYKAAMRVPAMFDNLFKAKYAAKFYIDQPQDISVLNAIGYDTTKLVVFGEGGVPDYVTKKITYALLMGETTIDGEGFTINDGAEWEEVFTKGAPKKIQSIEIRPSRNSDSISATAEGLDQDNSLIVSVVPQSFGPNVTNASGTTDTDLIEIIVNN